MFPLTALASGNDIIGWFWMEFVFVIALVIILAISKIGIVRKFLLFVVFIASQSLLLGLMRIPYSANQVLINVLSILVPTLVTGATYYLLISRDKKGAK